ncbi:hypothetical protein DFR51_2492 [Sphingosinicella microcystinivorans]|uniref:Uncharacterized protein n=1 Tax=Sphingosinicella microcystinivorans TaxID=335406 RepID=A0ABX9SZK4_SPHMI|nr:hypothetical protein DFR51_2492 [Sphingosinicella microcystinivorans]
MEHSQDYSPEPKKGHDAMHRARKRDTHPTHACSEDFCGFDGMRIASRLCLARGTHAIQPFFAMADRIAEKTVQ